MCLCACEYMKDYKQTQSKSKEKKSNAENPMLFPHGILLHIPY